MIINTSVILPFEIDLRREPEIIKNLEREVQRALHSTSITHARMHLTLPVVGKVVVRFDRIPAPQEEPQFHVTFIHPHDAEVAISEDDKKMFYSASSLPLEAWRAYWHHIYLEKNIKERALNYCLLAHNLRRYNVSRMVMAQHRIVIFYGPPGTGKTTVARGLANQFAEELRNSEGLPSVIYVEIKAHALSTVDLGGSPKLVAQAFGRVEELATTGLPVVCLVDEVESLLTNRTMTLNSANPVDVFRAVNAVFQQIDRLAERPNIYIFATSNLPRAIDRAFFDRADMLFFVGLPDATARCQILSDVFSELDAHLGTHLSLNDSAKQSPEWASLLDKTAGLSGRHLRKLVLEAMTNSPELARVPGRLRLTDILSTAIDYQERLERDRRHGGSYEYTYAQFEGANQHE